VKEIITPDLCDEFDSEIQIMSSGLAHYGGKTNFYGEIVTISCLNDNSKVGEILREKNGLNRVLVVDGQGSMRRALLGDMIAQAAIDNEWKGIIINGCVRDVEMLKEMPLGVMALSSYPLKTEKKGGGEIGVPVSFLDVNIRCGQFIFADETGVIISDRDLMET
jgi:regulator of ribonuclease activity A